MPSTPPVLPRANRRVQARQAFASLDGLEGLADPGFAEHAHAFQLLRIRSQLRRGHGAGQTMQTLLNRLTSGPGNPP
jgi:hypothetical protein